MPDKVRLAEWHVGADWQVAKDDVHCLALGRLVAQLQTVEVLIRLVLHERHDAQFGGTANTDASYMAGWQTERFVENPLAVIWKFESSGWPSRLKMASS
jgi:hypothetical protein